MNQLPNQILEITSNALEKCGIEALSISTLMWCAAIGVVVVAVLIVLFLTGPVAKIVNRLVEHTETLIDDILMPAPTVRAIGQLAAVIWLYYTLPECFAPEPVWKGYVSGLCHILFILALVQLINYLIIGTYTLLETHGRSSELVRSLKGIRQLAQTIVVCVGLIFIIAVLVGKSPWFVLSGLGASAAMLLLIFRETLVGLMAGIRLNTNDMLRVGDWITVPSRNINGTVEEICLTTVKIRNFDLTVVTVPPDALISGSFQNWRGMRMAGARRVEFRFHIDTTSIRRLTAEEGAKLYHRFWGEAPDKKEPTVNLTLFRRYLRHHLSSVDTFYTGDNNALMCIIRAHSPGADGLPLELYFFITETSWPEFESEKATILESIISMLPDFGLRLYQNPTGADLRQLAKECSFARMVE